MAGVTDASLNAEELLYLQTVVTSDKIEKDGKITKLDRTDSPVYNMMAARAQKTAQPANGGFDCFVSGNRGQKITWWDGRDILPFDSRETTMKMNYKIGRGHMGVEFLLDLMARAGVDVDYSTGIRRGGGSARKRAMEVAVRVIEDHWDDIRYNWVDELRKHVWDSNASQAKAFTGIRGLLTPSTTYSGTIGGLPRSNPLLQHNVIDSIDINNVELAFHQMIRRCTRRARTGIDVVACGDNFYDMLVDLFIGTSTRAGKMDYRARQDYAKAQGEKLGVGLPQNAFVTDEGVLIINEPTFEELQADSPASSPDWRDLCWFLNLDHLRMVPVKEQTVNHGVPYNQRVSRTSYHGEMAVLLDHPKSCGILIKA